MDETDLAKGQNDEVEGRRTQVSSALVLVTRSSRVTRLMVSAELVWQLAPRYVLFLIASSQDNGNFGIVLEVEIARIAEVSNKSFPTRFGFTR